MSGCPQRTMCTNKSALLFANIFIPEIRPFCDEILHHINTCFTAEIDYFHSMLFHEFNCTGKGFRLADNHFFYPKLNYSACTKITGHECGIECCSPVAPYSACITKAVDLCMCHRVIALHPLVMSAANNNSVFN